MTSIPREDAMSTLSPSRFSRRGVLGLAAAGLLGAAGCARGAGGGGTELRQPQSKVPTQFQNRKHKLVVWVSFGGSAGEAVNALGKAFNESQDETYAELQFQGDYDQTATKLTAALQSGTGPDLMIVNQTYQGKLMLQGLLEPLNGYLEAELPTYLPQLLSEWTVKDKVYQVPFARSTPIIYFNRDALGQAGLDDRAPESWEELRDWSGELAKLKDPKGKPMTGYVGDTDPWGFQAQVWHFGGLLSKGLEITIDQGGAVDAARFMQELYRSKRGIVGNREAFSNRFAAMAMVTTAAFTEIEKTSKFEVGAGFLPKGKGSGAPGGGAGWAMLAGVPAERKTAAAELIKFLARPENAAAWTVATGYLPVVQGAADQPVYRDRLKKSPYFDVAVQQLPESRSTDPVRSFLPGGRPLIEPGLQKMFVNFEDCDKTLHDLKAKLDSAAGPIREQYEKFYA